MQVLVLPYAVELIIASALILIIRVVCHATVNLAMGGILVDIETIHLISLEEGVVVGLSAEVLMDLSLFLGH